MLEPLKKPAPVPADVLEGRATPEVAPEVTAPRAQRRWADSIDELPSSTFRIPRV